MHFTTEFYDNSPESIALFISTLATHEENVYRLTADISSSVLKMNTYKFIDDFDKKFSYIKSDSFKWIQNLIRELLSFTMKFMPLMETVSSRCSNYNIDVYSQLAQINFEVQYYYGLSFYDAVTEFLRTLFNLWENNHLDVSNYAYSFKSVGWSKAYENIILDVLVSEVTLYLESTIKGDYVVPQLNNAKSWIHERVFSFLALFFEGNKLHKIEEALEMSFFLSFSNIRAHELFDIVAEYPDSTLALQELKDAIKFSSSISNVGHTYRQVLKKRLLHVGASTSQVLDMYISTVRAMRVIDSSDLLLNYVATPIRNYLRHRKDTVRCIVSSLSQGRSSELHGELRLGRSLEYGAVDEDDEEMGPGSHWEPVKKNMDLIGEGGRGLDILALLVSIYGSSDLFVKEYRSLLAEKLLSKVSLFLLFADTPI